MSTINVDTISDAAGSGKPDFPNGLTGDGSSLTSLTSANLTGALPAIGGSNLTSLTSSSLSGALPAIDGSALTGVGGSTTLGAVGTYAFLWRDNAGAAAGLTYSGSLLVYAVMNDDSSSAGAANVYRGSGLVRSSVSPSGTWRSMGSSGTYSASYGQTTLYVRIS